MLQLGESENSTELCIELSVIWGPLPPARSYKTKHGIHVDCLEFFLKNGEPQLRARSFFLWNGFLFVLYIPTGSMHVWWIFTFTCTININNQPNEMCQYTIHRCYKKDKCLTFSWMFCLTLRCWSLVAWTHQFERPAAAAVRTSFGSGLGDQFLWCESRLGSSGNVFCWDGRSWYLDIWGSDRIKGDVRISGLL